MLCRGVLLLLLFVWSRSCAGLVHRHGGSCTRPHVHRPGSDRRVPDALSEHMRTLYAKYARPGHAFKDGNTVRSFTARCGSLGSRRLQIFNLTSLRSSESVLSATLHFFSGEVGHRGPLGHMTNHTPGHMPRGPLQLHVWSSASAGGRALGHVRFDLSHTRARGGAWQWRDVTQLVQAAAQSRGEERGTELLIGVQLEWRNIPRELKWPPYILLYANDSAIAEPESVVHSLLQRPGQDQDRDQDQNQEDQYDQNQLQNLDQDQNHSLRRHHLSAKETVLQNQLQNLDQDQNLSLQRHHLPATETMLHNQLQNKTRSPSRHRRSVNLLSPLQNNELPEREYPVGAGQEEYPYDPTNWAEQSPNRNMDQNSPKQPGPPRRAKKRKIRKEGKDTGVLLRFDERTLKKARRKWAEPRGCARRYLKVDFADIGWSDWIISPKAYDAFYCSGACGFPMSKTLKPSNHATIQSIVRAVGVVPGVPEPCCVPEKMSSLSILFFDEQANVVLKVYPNMSVDSCACR